MWLSRATGSLIDDFWGLILGLQLTTGNVDLCSLWSGWSRALPLSHAQREVGLKGHGLTVVLIRSQEAVGGSSGST